MSVSDKIYHNLAAKQKPQQTEKMCSRVVKLSACSLYREEIQYILLRGHVCADGADACAAEGPLEESVREPASV